jgi:membrane fusion protein (multidrug efflux system)
MIGERKEANNKPGAGYILGWLVAMLVVFGAVGGLVFARQHTVQLQAAQLRLAERNGPHVLVKRALPAPAHRTIELPGKLHGFIETALYAKTAGYLKVIKVDKGDRVTKDEVLAILDSPELDKQVADAKANYWLQKTTDDRSEKLAQLGVMPQQQADDARAAMMQAQAAYQQLLAEQAYEIIRAPFAGIVTARYFDPGALIPQATSPSAATPILTLATLSPLRAYANVPQTVAPFIRDGMEATLSVPEYPKRIFKGTVTRHPQALDPASLTMLVEVDLVNEDRALYPGMYARVTLDVALGHATALVPDDSLIFRNNKIFVPLVRDARLHLAPVVLGWDNGYDVEVAQGVVPGDLVALTVGQSARDGEPVQPVLAR